ncbi:MAG TPA: hypothetical protein VKU19_19970 [Bryobacteraceae bacterium]|nr:hypothetical protein [Bryobacteraceae bacterium]
MARQPVDKSVWSAENRPIWVFFLLAVALPATAQTYISAEPIPSGTVVGPDNLGAIEGLGYTNMALWSQRLLGECHIVDNVIDTLSAHRAITTATQANTRYQVSAGGFQGVTDPSYVLALVDSGPLAVSQSDIFVLNNALGYVLNQDGTAQFSLQYNPNNPYDFALPYAVVTLNGNLTGEHAQSFFNYLGTIDAALWTGDNAGFTQIPLNPFGSANSMLFLIGSVSTSEFEIGLYQAVTTTSDATYSPDNHGNPNVATAGAAFPGNDWSAFPNGDQYLVNLPNSPTLLSDLAALRQSHLRAVANLLPAIAKGTVDDYLHNQFRCP